MPDCKSGWSGVGEDAPDCRSGMSRMAIAPNARRGFIIPAVCIAVGMQILSRRSRCGAGWSGWHVNAGLQILSRWFRCGAGLSEVVEGATDCRSGMSRMAIAPNAPRGFEIPVFYNVVPSISSAT